MNKDHDQRSDVSVVLHAVLTLALALMTATSLGYVVPELFNMHSSVADLGAIIVTVVSIAFAYLAGRYLWSSHRITMERDEE